VKAYRFFSHPFVERKGGSRPHYLPEGIKAKAPEEESHETNWPSLRPKFKLSPPDQWENLQVCPDDAPYNVEMLDE